MNRVCAVIVTYNRKELLVRNIDSVLRQSHEADIIIYDNASTDGTKDYLSQKGYIQNQHVIYFEAKENTGGAGGFSNGMQMAYDKGYEYIWLMDDDGYSIDGDTLKTLVDFYEKQHAKVILNSLVLCDEKAGLLSFTLHGKRCLKDLEGYRAGDETVKGDISSFNSTFFHRSLIDEIGVVRADLFIYGDDTDYLERAKKAGYELITVVNSRYFHPDSGMGYKRVFGQAVGLRKMDARRRYYYTRNYMYIMRHYRSTFQALRHIPAVIFKNIVLGGEWKNIGGIIKGLVDGWNM